jgi:transketolase
VTDQKSRTALELEWTDLDRKAVDTVRALAADAVQKTGNGHPGTAISLAPLAYLLFQKVMRRDPSDSTWVGRDRFILSNGHSSLTQYIQFYLGGYGLELEDLKQLRQYGSKTPGHPEYGHTDGVEITTGPLGSGLAASVGFAYAQRFERGLFDPDAPQGESLFDHYIYVIAGDGDMEEGVTNEASSLAGTQQLGNLILFYDDNQISIEDDTNIALSEDVAARYEALGWHVQTVDWKAGEEYHEDVEALYAATLEAQRVTDKPSLIVLKTIIGWPAPTLKNTGKIHGAAMGDAEIKGMKLELDLDPEKTFDVAPEVLEHTRKAVDRGQASHADWNEQLEAWSAANPERKALLDRVLAGDLPEDAFADLPVFPAGKAVSTRVASGKVINAIAPRVPEFWGGSADLAESNNTAIEGDPSFLPPERGTAMWKASPYGRTLHFGIREHAMGNILNGIVLHGNTRVFGATFMIFSDYMRPPVRLAALMKAPTIYVWTHDSVALGGDGPTHQPVEQLWSLRLIPQLDVIRPGDANETAAAWKQVMSRRMGPAALALSRQNLPVFERGTGAAEGDTYASAEGVAKGAYVFAAAKKSTPDVILIGTGSELQVAVEARLKLAEEGIDAQVVSAPCLEWFDEQSPEYKESVLPSAVKARVSVEAGATLPWAKYVGDRGEAVGIDHFGASADGDFLLQKFGITTEHVVAAAKESLGR